ncbi:class I SAM-dependent methyltransferase [Candidatus Dojkabacteria bacterium]|uniref:Class I SAM-dependent methyltransferase n=1 Tax=Candidatus Dojkabacteria bacterium TaxID=2099670 RepID=A0A5C7J8M2_9BACT|nr:MAG: class I SAM-dependent methyltransferase [Candidatus Dojkabacteria bacterium]
MMFTSAYEAIKPSHLDNDTAENAQRYDEREITGITILAYRDLPMLINKHVTGPRALDFGCGTGFSTRLLKSLGFDVIGVDISLNMLSYAWAKKDGIPYAHIQHGKINADENTFDLVLSVMVHFDIPSIAMVEQTQAEISRVLKPGGIFIGVVGSEHLHVNNWSTLMTDVEKNRNIKSGEVYAAYSAKHRITFYDYFYADSDYKNVFAKTGLALVETHFPLGEESDDFKWSIETKTPAHAIYVCQKS